MAEAKRSLLVCLGLHILGEEGRGQVGSWSRNELAIGA